MAANQEHGFKFEKREVNKRDSFILWKDYVEKFPEVDSDGIYTSKYDAVDLSRRGVKYHGKPVQFKNIKKKGSVDFGSIFRNRKHTENFDLIVGFWEYEKTNIVELYELKIDHKKLNSHFEWSDELYDELYYWIKNEVSNSYSYDEEWTKKRKEYKKLWGKNRLIQPRFKRDHEDQKRIQCGVGYKKFIKEFVKNGIVNE